MSEPIRVLHVLGGLNRGGAETMIMNLYKNLDRSKIQFDFIIHTDKEKDCEDEIKNLGGRIYVFPRFVGTNYFVVRKCWSRFFKEHPEYKILHSHVRSYASVYLPIAKRHGVKTIIHSHSTSNGNGIKSIIKRIMQYPLRYQADRFIGCSEESGRWLFGKKILKSDKYCTLKNAIETKRFRYNEQNRQRYRKMLDIEGKTVYVHIGRLHRAKNHAFLLDLFSSIHRKNPDSVLICVGEGELRAEIEARILELGLSSSVMMLGIRRDVECILSCADVFLFPSIWEGVPLAVVEAQASNIPCLVSDRVDSSACVTELAVRLPIDGGIEIWEKALDGLPSRDRSESNDIAEYGYDVEKSAEWIESYYKSLV